MNEKSYKKFKLSDERKGNVVNHRKVEVKIKLSKSTSFRNHKTDNEQAIHYADDPPK
jgi:hypothetical protein